MGSAQIYDPIDDWTPEGRKRLVETRGDEIRALLDLAFTEYVETHAVGLSAYGFVQDDPVGEAVEWAMHRFMTGDIDPARLHAGSRSFRIFTETRFWLHQKVGREGYERIQAAVANQPAEREEGQGTQSESASIAETIQSFGTKLATNLRTLGHNTCADLVGFWLDATKTLRREWFGWRERGEVTDKAAGLSKKQRSFYGHDAMFRFLCFLHDLAPSSSHAPAKRALSLTTLSPCENTPPYRVPDRLVVPHLSAFGVRGSRDVANLRKEGACKCLRHCIELASANDLDSEESLAAELTRRSLGPTTLHALGIEGDVVLRDQINLLSKSIAEISS